MSQHRLTHPAKIGGAEHASAPRGRYLALLSLTALGIVYGDIGTSPLYAVRESFLPSHGLAVTPANVFGVLSLIFWSLVLVISVKYLIFVLRADNRGEGGILALAALCTPMVVRRRGGRWWLIMLGLFGTALLYGDGAITPAISVLSAVEGLEVATPFFAPYIIPITIAILIALFLAQRHGTAKVGVMFGPVTLLWFITLVVLGVRQIIQEPAVLTATSPVHAITFFLENRWRAVVVLGSVFLVVTGGEALYADMGHFGRRPMRVAWFVIVLPALLINYFGQGALLIHTPAAVENPFYRMAPEWALYPVVVIATAATVIASQALISGAFSLTMQAVQLGYIPRVAIDHTSAREFGQIYIPAVNRALMIACIALVLGFRSSSNLAAAYGIAITITMVITTLLFFLLVVNRWQWHPVVAVLFAVFFLAIDLSFFGANILKVLHGGWFPLLMAGVIYLLMGTWRDGRKLLAARLRSSTLSTELFVADLLSAPPVRVPGVAVFMSGNPMGTPLALRQNVAHNHVLHDCNIILGVRTADTPHVAPGARLETEEIGEGFFRVSLAYGFMEEPNVPKDLTLADCVDDNVDPKSVSYFLGRETVLATPEAGMHIWRESLFAFMARNAQPATLFFHLPADRVVEIGAQVEL